jgi:trigger factor
MNVTREDVDELNAVLRIQVSPEDYQEKYEASLKDYRKRMNIPGFRQGKVPMGVVKKRFGSSIVAEEVDKVLNNSLNQYITENKLDILGRPLPKDEGKEFDWNNPSDFEFAFELGFAPQFNVELSDKNKFDYFTVKVDDTLIDKQVEDFGRRYGKMTHGETSEDKDMLLGSFEQLDEEGNVIEGGIKHTSTVSIEYTEDDAAKKSLVGLTGGDTVVLDPRTVSKDDADMAAMLGLKQEDVSNLNSQFKFTVNEIKRIEPHEPNQELFDKIYGKDEITSEEEFRAKIADELSNVFVRDSDNIFSRDISKSLMESLSLSLPDEFLKKFILSSNANEEKPATEEQVEADYPNYSEGLKWQLIQNQIIKANEINVAKEEVIDYTKHLLGNQYAQYGMPPPEDAELTESANKALANREEAQRIYDTLYNIKLLEYFKNTVKLDKKEISYDDFVAKAKAEQ